MAKEIIINAEKEYTRIAIVENGELAELYFETEENERTLGDVYLGRIRRVMPSIRAAFVDIGQKQDAFLHFSDMAEDMQDWLAFVDQDKPEIARFKRTSNRTKNRRHRPKGGKRNTDAGKDGKTGHRKSNSKARGQRRSAQQRSKRKGNTQTPRHRRAGRQPHPESYLKRDQRVLVKITKEPISNKGSRVAGEISLAGRFLVLVPMANYAAVSKKITSHKERRRLKALAQSLLPEGFGVIVRTVAEGRDAKSLDTDLRLLLDKWRNIEKKLAGRPEPPLKVHEDVNMASSIIRDLFSEDYDRILIDHPRMYRNVKNYIHAVAPQMEKVVQQHRGPEHIFEKTKIKKDIEEVFESRIQLPSGGYLFIERTEAMHVVDVNSGRSGRGMSQEESSLKVNLEAARAIARQIRLRDLGGIIVVDFIDLRYERNRKKVYDELKKEFRKDRAVTKLLPMSDFGLVQITRQRLRPSITTTYSGADASSGNGAEKPEKEPAPASKGDNNQQRQDKSRKDNQRSNKSRRDDNHRNRRREAQHPRAPRIGPEEMVKQIEAWIQAYKASGVRGPLALHVHPFTAAYLNRKVPTYPTRWFMKHLVRLRVESDKTMPPMTFRFLDPRSNEDLTEKYAPKQEAVSG